MHDRNRCALDRLLAKMNARSHFNREGEKSSHGGRGPRNRAILYSPDS